MNILDLNSDILNIIGDYVKKDNAEKEIDEIIENLKNKNVFVEETDSYIFIKFG